MFGSPSLTFFIVFVCMPFSWRYFAVPWVHIRWSPAPCIFRAIGSRSFLSAFLIDMKTVPVSGSSFSALVCALKNACAKSLSIPMTSPVLRISGLRSGSAPGRWSNGRSTSFTETFRGMISLVYPRSWRLCPIITFAAILASGSPVAFDTNGMVRLDLGFASST